MPTTIVLRLLLLAMPLVAYIPLWDNQLIDWDDEQLITLNPNISGGPTWENILWALREHRGPYWMPVTNLTFLVDAGVTPGVEPNPAYLSELSAAMFHGQNLFWQCCNVQFLFGLLRWFGGTPGQRFAVAALFAVHPMHVESVAWAIERKDMLMCFFGLLGIGCYFRYVDTSRWWRWAYFGAMLVSYQMSLMSKPMLLTFPFLLLLLDFWPLNRWRLKASTAFGKKNRSENFGLLILEKLPVFAIAMAMAVQTLETRPAHSMVDLSMLDTAMNVFAGYKNYLVTTCYPTDLAILYPHAGKNWSMSQSLLGFGLVAIGSTISLYWCHSRPWFAVGWFWFLGTLLPVMGLKQGGSQAWADRFSYFPHIGLFVAIVWATTGICRRLGVPIWVRSVLIGAVLGCLMVLTWIQVGYWRNSITVWERAVAAVPGNYRAHDHLAIAYRREGRSDLADYHLHEAARIQFERRRQK